jgi:hypothetical protein
MHALVQWAKFDGRRATARTFLDRILRQRQRVILRQRRSKRGPSFVSLSHDLSLDRRRNGPRDHAVDLDAQHDIALISSRLPAPHRDLASGLKEHKVAQLARIQGRYRQRLHEAIRQIRQRFHDADLQEYLR